MPTEKSPSRLARRNSSGTPPVTDLKNEREDAASTDAAIKRRLVGACGRKVIVTSQDREPGAVHHNERGSSYVWVRLASRRLPWYIRFHLNELTIREHGAKSQKCHHQTSNVMGGPL